MFTCSFKQESVYIKWLLVTHSHRAVSLCCVRCWMTRAHSLGHNTWATWTLCALIKPVSSTSEESFSKTWHVICFKKNKRTLSPQTLIMVGRVKFVCLTTCVCVCLCSGRRGGDIVFDQPANNNHIMTLPHYFNRVRAQKANNSR